MNRASYDKMTESLYDSHIGDSFKAIAFNCIDSEIENYLSTSYKKRINIIGKLSLNEWQGKHNIEFIIEDISVIKTQ